MSDVVFILGAGASKHAGVPVMKDFLDKARELYASGQADNYRGDFERVFEAISRLQSVHSKSELDLVNLESVFGAFEMQKLLETDTEAVATVASMARVIAHTIDRSISTAIAIEGDRFLEVGYRRLAQLVGELGPKGISTALLTFNYDLAFDYALASSGISPSYHLSDNETGPVPLLKLHGSLNWARCPQCNDIFPLHMNRGFPMLTSFQTARNLPNSSHCGPPYPPDPVIVPPSWDKAGHHSSLARVWRRAALELSTASSIFICGYSLPDTDLFFRYLYALGSVGDTLLQRFWVCDLDPSVQQRFQSMLGPGARRRFRPIQGNFEHVGMDEISRAMRNL